MNYKSPPLYPAPSFASTHAQNLTTPRFSLSFLASLHLPIHPKIIIQPVNNNNNNKNILY